MENFLILTIIACVAGVLSSLERYFLPKWGAKRRQRLQGAREQEVCDMVANFDARQAQRKDTRHGS